MMNANPVFNYLQGSTWYNPVGAYVVNSIDYISWGSYTIGGGTATPYAILEGGHLQCSTIGTYQLYLGYYANSPLYGCGTQTYATKLMN